MKDLIFKPEWRTQSRRLRRFYAKYLKWLINAGYIFCIVSLFALIWAFIYRVDEVAESQANEPGIVEASFDAIRHPARVGLVRLLAEEFSKVKKGDKLFEAAEPLANENFANWLMRPPRNRSVFTAPSDGIFILSASTKNGFVLPNAELARVVRYEEIWVNGVVKGESLSQITLNSKVILSQIDLDRNSRSLLRISEGSKSEQTSKSFLEANIRAKAEESVKGLPITIRNDRTLQVDTIDRLEVEVATNNENLPIDYDPPRSALLNGQLIAGTHRAKVQLANLPLTARNNLEGLLTSNLGALDLRSLVLQVNLSQSLESNQNLADSFATLSPIDRSFDARIRILDPPTWLIDKLIEQDRLGKPIRAKIEIVSSNRPLALKLLKRN